jgi:fructose-1-phosphate kinase PfkB-like protein
VEGQRHSRKKKKERKKIYSSARGEAAQANCCTAGQEVATKEWHSCLKQSLGTNQGAAIVLIGSIAIMIWQLEAKGWLRLLQTHEQKVHGQDEG